MNKKIKNTANIAKIAIAATRAKIAPGEDSKQRAHEALATWMADARGVPTKIGQFLAGSDDQSAFQPLLEALPPLDLEPILQHLDQQLGHPWTQTFKSIEPSQAAASLGQVHKATLHDDTPVAIKIQYPDIANSVQNEMKLLGLLPKMGPVKKWGFDLKGYKQHLFDSLTRELDYTQEAQKQTRFHDETPIPGLIVPRVHPEFSTKTILIQDWQQAKPLADALNWTPAQQRRLGKIIMRTFWYTAFHNGHIHGDPHLGNIKARLNPNPELIIMDYGCTLDIPENARLALLHLILRTTSKRPVDPLACFIAMGFDGQKLAPIANQLPALCTTLFEPFIKTDRVYNTKYWQLAPRLEGILGELKWWFRSAGPPDLFLLMRAFAGLLNHLDTINMALNWSEELHAILPPETIQKADNYTPPPVPPHITRTTTGYDSMAQYLKVRVTEGSKQIVNVTMPAIQVSQLETLIQEETLQSIQKAGINVKALGLAACERGIIPQELFTHTEGPRTYTVWLE